MITVSIEMARALRKAGWVKTCHFYYGWGINENGTDSWELTDDPPRKNLPAPTCEEILREMPGTIREGDVYMLHAHPLFKGGWSVGYLDFNVVHGYSLKKNKDHDCNMPSMKIIGADTLSDAAAECYCYLAENNLLSKHD